MVGSIQLTGLSDANANLLGEISTDESTENVECGLMKSDTDVITSPGTIVFHLATMELVRWLEREEEK